MFQLLGIYVHIVSFPFIHSHFPFPCIPISPFILLNTQDPLFDSLLILWSILLLSLIHSMTLTKWALFHFIQSISTLPFYLLFSTHASEPYNINSALQHPPSISPPLILSTFLAPQLPSSTHFGSANIYEVVNIPSAYTHSNFLIASSLLRPLFNVMPPYCPLFIYASSILWLVP